MASDKPDIPRGASPDRARDRDLLQIANKYGADALAISQTGISIDRPGLRTRLAVRLADTVQHGRERLAQEWLLEREAGGLFNLVPVLLALGITGYFWAQAEPLFAMLLATAAIALALAMTQRHHSLVHAIMIATMLVFAGAALAQWRTQATNHPVLDTGIKARISGIVIEADTNSRGSPRYLIRPGAIDKIPGGKLPYLVRISAGSKGQRFEPGDAIVGLASLQPLSGPAYPGGYDFGFFARFDGMGGAGFFMGAPKVASTSDAVPALSTREILTIALNRFRREIASRIRVSLPGDEGAVAIALITGDRSAIPSKIQDSLRQSGLAHILAISGLHMALVTLTVVAVLRHVLAWFPALALHYPIRKWAACAGLLSASLYLVISGASVATQRAWLMIAIMLAATLADRRALTIRNVALAATIILCLSPEALLEPGFQMSFAAAAALVAAYEAVTERNARRFALRGRETPGWAMGVVKSAVTQVSSLAFTSIVAGIATGLFAAWHFHRIAPMGFVANLAAMPVVSFLVMPLALLSSLLMPYGLEFLTLDALGWSIRRVVEISDWANSFGISGVTGAKPMAFLALGATGLACLTLLRSKLRLLGLAFAAFLPLTFSAGKPPDLLISQDGRAIAMATSSGRLLLAYPRRNAFVSDIWLRAYSGGMAESDRSMIGKCDKDHCIATLQQAVSVHVVFAPKLLAQACEQADILVAPRLRWVNCKGRKPAIILKREDFENRGTHAIHLPQHPRLQMAAARQIEGKPSVPPAKSARQDRPTRKDRDAAMREWLQAALITTAIHNGNRPWQKPAIVIAEDADTPNSAGSTRRGGLEPLPDPE